MGKENIFPYFFYVATKVTYFFYPDKVVFAHFWGIFFEWMKKLFFWGLFFFSGLENRMNEWHVNFSAKKKQKKNARIWGKQKKQNKFLLKKIRGFLKIRMNGQWTFPWKKKHILFFSDQKYDFGKKKIFWFQWMDGLWTYPRKKKYGTFDS